MSDETQTGSDLVISHTAAEGTVVAGTARGDGSAPVLKANAWRGSRNLGSWYVPRSRDAAPDTSRIETTATGLREAGFTVAVTIDSGHRDAAQIEADREARQSERVANLGEAVQRRAEHAEHLEATASAMAAVMPFGQPVLVGHHSQARDTHHRERIATLSDRAVTARDELRDAQHRYTQAAAGYSPVTVANRVERLAAAIRDVERRLAGYSHTFAGGYVETYPPAEGEYRARLLAQLDRDQDHHAYWQTVRADQIASGTATGYTQDTVHRGDAVCIRGRWVEVVRANRKTVSVTTGYDWTDTVPYAAIQRHRSPTTTENT